MLFCKLFSFSLELSNNAIICFSSELIRNRTLDFLSKTLPVLKADDTLPKVTQILDEPVNVVENNG